VHLAQWPSGSKCCSIKLLWSTVPLFNAVIKVLFNCEFGSFFAANFKRIFMKRFAKEPWTGSREPVRGSLLVQRILWLWCKQQYVQYAWFLLSYAQEAKYVMFDPSPSVSTILYIYAANKIVLSGLTLFTFFFVV
jgi:hypothetical protein